MTVWELLMNLSLHEIADHPEGPTEFVCEILLVSYRKKEQKTTCLGQFLRETATV